MLSEEFQAGSLLAGYRLEERIGAGGMAVVFRACDERLGRLVALKILAPEMAEDQEFRRRFIAESRAAAKVEDPHIIPIYEAGEADGVLFIAMRFVAGGDLRRVLERERALAPGRAVEFISPVASALDAAHRAGLVHRDVKPANILVDASPDRPDHVYLSDFGVSKGAVSSASLTGQFLGTPNYSAPEQIQCLAVDGRADQYALACVAYQLLTGKVPFERDKPMTVLYAHVCEPPPSLVARRPDLPSAADRVLARAMAKAPENRYGCCRDFADALREALGLSPYPFPQPRVCARLPANSALLTAAQVKRAGCGRGRDGGRNPIRYGEKKAVAGPGHVSDSHARHLGCGTSGCPPAFHRFALSAASHAIRDACGLVPGLWPGHRSDQDHRLESFPARCRVRGLPRLGVRLHQSRTRRRGCAAGAPGRAPAV